MTTTHIPDHTVTRTTRDGEELAVVEITRRYSGEVDDVWSALTDPERLPRWFSPVHGDLRLGGRFQIEGNAAGEVTACNPPSSFSVTWEFGGGTSWVDVTVVATGPDAARVTIAHTVPTDNDHWRQFGPAAVGIGWDLSVAGLGVHLDGGAVPVGPEDENAWAVSDAGLAFIRGCGEAWYAADVDGGANPADARARADASVAFFSTAPEEAAPDASA